MNNPFEFQNDLNAFRGAVAGEQANYDNRINILQNNQLAKRTKALTRAKEFAEKVQAQKALEAEQERQAQINAARAALAYQTQTGEGSGYTGGFDPSTQNYDDPFDPGQTE